MEENKQRILIADDDPRAAQSVQALMRMHGFEAGIVDDGARAIEEMQRRRIDLLLLDLMMPQVSGLGVMDFIEDNEIDVTVIVVSGDASIENAVHSLRRGAYDYLRKPYAPEVLVRTVENALRKRQLEHENRLIEGKLKHSERLYRYMVNSSPDIIYMLDNKGVFTFISERVEWLLGYAPGEVVGQHYSMLVHPDDLEKAQYAFNERRTGPRATHNIEIRLKCRDTAAKARYFDTDTLPIELSSMGMYVVDGDDGDDDKHYVGTYGVARDVTDRKRAEEVIQYQAFHDTLTGLPNRALFKDRVQLAISQAGRREQKLAVMFLDLDRFKMINDTLGHVHGDELLQLVSGRLQNCMRGGDTIARVGGDEFMILIPQASREDAGRVAQKVIDELRTPFLLEGHEVFVSTSIGIAMFPEHGDNIDTLIKNADIAMYHIKDRERDGFEFFNDQMNVRLSYFLSIESGIRRALEHDGFQLVYQPLFDVESDDVVSLEALMRWNHPERGIVSPNEFVPHAEECGLIVPIGDWVLRRALEDLKSWRLDGLPPIRLSVNVSAAQLATEHVEDIVGVLKEYGVPGSSLEIEITENVIMKDIDSVVHRLNTLSRHGVHIAIDDFGTGYSSLSYLQKLPIHTLKIDRSFVWAIRSEKEQATIVNAIIAMAKGMGLNLVAEGVENALQLEYLKARGCHIMQGFFLGKPVPADETGELLERRSRRVGRLA